MNPVYGPVTVIPDLRFTDWWTGHKGAGTVSYLCRVNFFSYSEPPSVSSLTSRMTCPRGCRLTTFGMPTLFLYIDKVVVRAANRIAISTVMILYRYNPINSLTFIVSAI